MRQTALFTKTQKNISSEETAKNAQILLKGSFIYKNSAGVYTYLPLGWRVINNLNKIIKQEMDKIFAQEIFMPALVENRYLETTDRINIDVGFDVMPKNEKNASYVLGWTHEEIVTEIASKYVKSYRDLPFATYQIQTKFRNEKRAKSGLLRGREFFMKDLYSFHKNEKDLFEYYEKVKEAYNKIFKRCELETYYTLADGGDFTISNTHEFQVISEAGEDVIFYCEQCKAAENQEISKLKEQDKCKKCDQAIKKASSIEVGNIFPLGTKYSDCFGLRYNDENDKELPVYMGSYGIGIGRLMATIVEVLSDENGAIWPREVAPMQVHIVTIGDNEVIEQGEVLYKELLDKNIDVLFDDRDVGAGEKLKDADLIGVPLRIVLSSKTQEQGGFGIKLRSANQEEIVSKKDIYKLIDNY